MDGENQLRRKELGRFLRAKRLTRQSAVPARSGRGRKRKRSMSREEVAARAGIGVCWYTWLEQGRAEAVSAETLSYVLHALEADALERNYAHQLAGHWPAFKADCPHWAELCSEQFDELLGELGNVPAFVCDEFFDILVCNPLWRHLFSESGAPRDNLVQITFAASFADVRLPDREQECVRLTAALRHSLGATLCEPEKHRRIARWCRDDAEFARLWSQHRVSFDFKEPLTVERSGMSNLRFARSFFRATCDPSKQLVAYMPADAETRAQLDGSAQAPGLDQVRGCRGTPGGGGQAQALTLAGA